MKVKSYKTLSWRSHDSGLSLHQWPWSNNVKINQCLTLYKARRGYRLTVVIWGTSQCTTSPLPSYLNESSWPQIFRTNAKYLFNIDPDIRVFIKFYTIYIDKYLLKQWLVFCKLLWCSKIEICRENCYNGSFVLHFAVFMMLFLNIEDLQVCDFFWVGEQSCK